MDRCALCPAKHNLVPPSGPEGSDVIFIGEAPGKDEDREGIPFVGKTGREVNEHYLPLAGLRRASVRFTNAIKCLPDRPQGKIDLNRDKDRELLHSCSELSLYCELEQSRHTLIVPMGVLACYAIDPDINLELQHGIPIETAWGTVFPMYHPASSLHEPKKMTQVRTDWVRLGKYLKGKLKLPVNRYTNPDYAKIDADELLSFYLECNDYTFPMAIDTEVTRFREPFCLTFSTFSGTGRLILAEDKDALEIFQCMLDRWQGYIIMHNGPFDIPVLEAMGLRVPFKLVRDTMTLAYHLGNLPQGLKTLAFRELGMTMTDFDDVTLPHSIPLCLEYLKRASMEEFPKPEEQLVRDAEGKWKMYRPQSVTKKIKRFLQDFQKHPDKNPIDIWDNWESDHKLIEMVCGPFPGKDIRHVPLELVIEYACRDSDSTLRLWDRLSRIQRVVRKKLPEHWTDAE